ncbi:UPF0149 family protein [Nitrosomonas sp. Is79A3]|uniref:UPF0149 family protein n=1 Tax=Nitrosomonas sp. (strain Is79A3) TaxID=261292 RepID=UPI0002DA531F
MKKNHPDTMSEADYDQLSLFLDRFKHELAMNLEMLDGFFTALHCSPEIMPPSTYFPEIWGDGEMPDDEAFENDQQAEIFVKLLLRHWNDVLHRLKNEKVFLPIIFSDESGESFSGNDWAKGFMRGTEFHRADWLDLMDNEEEGGALVAIFALFYEHDPDPSMRPYKEPVSEELREKLLINLSAGVMHIYRYFEPQRKMASQLARQTGTLRREQAKTGRNAPCPCGSGKKYKKCCGEVTLH